jgi:beta-glucosidase
VTTTAARALAILLLGFTFVTGACRRQVTFSQSEIDQHAMLSGLTPKFWLGVATSAYQTEGGNHNDWTDWEMGRYPDGTPHISDGSTAARAADSWNLWSKDVAALEDVGANVYRLGVEWSRLEPREGAWDQGAAARYKEILQALRHGHPRSIEPMLNLYHFTLPPWVVARGGWEWEGAPAAFAAFASRAADAFGADVDLWCTLNEPNVYVSKGYMAGQWPPGVKDPKRAVQVLARLLQAHGLAVAALRAHDRVDADGDGAATRIGLAHNVIVFDPASSGPVDALVARAADRFYNLDIPNALHDGRIRISLPTVISIDEPAPQLIGSLDWLGLNYYTHQKLSSRLFSAHDASAGPYQVIADASRPHNDMGWEIYPEGLYRVLVRFQSFGWPLLVAESGVADRAGTVRPGFIRSHIYALDRARAEGVDVIGYMHWSLMDNFEWSHGYAGRFGLYTIDFAGDPGLARRPTAAVATFQQLARAIGTLPP